MVMNLAMIDKMEVKHIEIWRHRTQQTPKNEGMTTVYGVRQALVKQS